MHAITRIGLGIVLAALVSVAGGCAEQVRWDGFMYEPVRQDARRAGKPLLVYLRSWYLPDCTEFESGPLQAPAVVALSRNFKCANLEYDWNKSAAEKWGVKQAPAIVLFAPDGELLGVLQGTISAATLQTTLKMNLELIQPAAPATPTSAPAN